MWLRWIFENAEIIAALVVIVPAAAGAITWMVRMFLASKARVDRLIRTVDTIANVFAPAEGKNLAEVVRDTRDEVSLMRTEQVAIKTRLETNIARQWAVMAGSKEPIFEVDQEGHNWRVNRAYTDLVGRSAEEVRGRGWELTVHPADRDRVIAEWHDAIAGKRGLESDFRIVSRTGQETHRVRCVATPLFCDARILTGYLGRYENVEKI